MSSFQRIAPVFAVRDLVDSLAYYRRLGFQTREYEGGGYGYLVRDEVEIHLGQLSDDHPRANPSTAYIWVSDADETARAWRAAGAEVHQPEDTDWGRHEGVLTDIDGNLIRFGSPVAD